MLEIPCILNIFKRFNEVLDHNKLGNLGSLRRIGGRFIIFRFKIRPILELSREFRIEFVKDAADAPARRAGGGGGGGGGGGACR